MFVKYQADSHTEK